ncbi:MAG: sensor histidine kinase [Lachnospiraceae bacterium]|nr:sensor histidine kinase [Lachnospiraceae bacterium]
MMEETICLALYLLTEFINYTLTYDVIFQSPVTKKKRNWLFSFLVVFLVHFFVMYYGGLELAFNISIFTMIIVPVCLLETRKMKNYVLYFFVVFMSATIISCVSFILAVLLDISESSVREDSWLTVIRQMVPAILLLCIFIYIKIRKKDEIQIQLGIWQYILIFICLFCVYQTLGPIQALSSGNVTQKNINACGVGISITCIIFVILILWQGIFLAREIRYKERNKNSEELLKMQTEYFEQTMSQDETMRRLRHDMNAHIAALKSFCNTNENEELEKYLNTMIKESAIYDVKVYTGNKSVDAVLRPLLEDAKKKEIQVEIQGTLPDVIEVSTYDLCTIFSNLLRNAIESCEKIEDNSNRVIKLTMVSYQSLLFITMENTVVGEVKIKGNQLVTTKKDVKYHGLGSGNVRNAIKKYDGRLSYQCENGWFKAEIEI